MNTFSKRPSSNGGSTILNSRKEDTQIDHCNTSLVPFRLPVKRIPLHTPPSPQSSSVQPFCSYVASDKRSGLVKRGGDSSIVIPTTHGTSFRDLKIVEHRMLPTRTKSTSSDIRPLFSLRSVSKLRPNYMLRQRCPGPKQNVWRKCFSKLYFGITQRYIVSSALTQERSTGVPIRQEAGWAPEPRSSDAKISTHVRDPVRSQSLHCVSYWPTYIWNATAQYFETKVEFTRLYVTAYLTVIIANNKNADIHESNQT